MSILSQDDRDIIILASTIRGDIRCVHSTERKCGYIIRPELWFTVMKAGAARALVAHNIPVKNMYGDERHISSLLNIIAGLEDLSPTTDGINLVRDLNGRLKQPSDYSQVLSALELIESLRGVISDATLRQYPAKRNEHDRGFEDNSREQRMDDRRGEDPLT